MKYKKLVDSEFAKSTNCCSFGLSIAQVLPIFSESIDKFLSRHHDLYSLIHPLVILILWFRGWRFTKDPGEAHLATKFFIPFFGVVAERHVHINVHGKVRSVPLIAAKRLKFKFLRYAKRHK